jgi:abequosyltransferase
VAARLSICIPTYNYGAYIGEALRSVAHARTDEIEIIVLDGGSQDDTAQVVRTLERERLNIRYVRQGERGGIDRDLARSVELATGEYCWLLSADDALAPGALERLLAECDNGFDVMLANRMWCDVHLRPIGAQAWLSDTPRDTVFDFRDRGQLKTYLATARSLGALFSFMSSIGFRRTLWLDSAPANALAGSNYAHVYRLFVMARKAAALKYVAEPLVLCRSGNDSFAREGLARRLTIDLRGYLKLSQTLFPDDAELQRCFRAVLRREHSWRVWMYAREVTREPARWRELEQLLRHYGFSLPQLAAIRLIAVVSRWRRQCLRRAALI